MSQRRVCRTCGRRRSIEKFRVLKFRARRNPHVMLDCRDCEKRDRFALDLKLRYGITIEEYGHMMNRQGQVCAICEQEMVTTNVDHCHTLGHVRGLLCTDCNVGIGRLKDDVRVIANAIRYLAA